jgi:hypothetical protein
MLKNTTCGKNYKGVFEFDFMRQFVSPKPYIRTEKYQLFTGIVMSFQKNRLRSFLLLLAAFSIISPFLNLHITQAQTAIIIAPDGTISPKLPQSLLWETRRMF